MSETVNATVREAISARVEVRGHVVTIGEPVEKGGTDDGASPMEMFLAGLGACVGITLRMYANLKGLPVREIRVAAAQARKKRGEVPAEAIEEGDEREELPVVELSIEVEGDLTDAQVDRLRYIARRCPVHRVLTENPVVRETLNLVTPPR